MKRLSALTWILCGLLWVTLSAYAASPANLVANPSFEQELNGAPAAWAAAGSPDVRQQLRTEAGRDGGRCTRLECSVMGQDSPSAHAMVCQVGQVGVRQGQWYRLTFWARGERIRNGTVSVALTCTSPWQNVGLDESLQVTPEWERFEFAFRAKESLPAKTSRLQFWFKSTGTLWLDDVELVETAEVRPQRFPQIATDHVKNFVPNASFECGTANWGSWHREPGGWGNHLYRLEGEIDTTGGAHGKQCLKIALSPERAPVYYFDYFETSRRPVRQALAANQGWFKVQPGEKLTLSAFLRADAERVAAQLAVIASDGRVLTREVRAETQWRRFEYTFTPTQPFCFIAVGLDLDASQRDAATLWVDAVQLERGEHATEFTPREPVESFITTEAPGNIFSAPAAPALQFTLRAFNNAASAQTVAGNFTATDFFDQPVANQPLTLAVPAQSGAQRAVPPIAAERLGFFRATWLAGNSSNRVRAARIQPVARQETPVGMNHAYPWQFLVQRSHLAGINTWRDWSAKWHVVEPVKGQFDFRAPDEQVQRVLDVQGNVVLLLPFPSSRWASTYQADQDREPPKDAYTRLRLPLAFAPRDLNDFSNYVATTTRHYQGRVKAIHILNEPLFTSYSLPATKGYKIEDYVRHLEVAYRAVKAVSPACQVVGGIGLGPSADWNRQFVTHGGLRWVDIFDMHLYTPPAPAESHDEEFAAFEQLMRANGGPRPVWMTEMGCYADDDPPAVPQTVGDSAMNRCKWKTERAAAEYLVKFTAVTFAHGMRKIFLHAGTCGEINGPDAGGVFFEYGGAPRKMYPAMAPLSQLLGTPDAFVEKLTTGGCWCYVFQRQASGVAIAWCEQGKEKLIQLPAGITAYDIMGNAHPTGTPLRLDTAPIYLLGRTEAIQALMR
ncbi:MAG: glycosyl hydrolase [Verrucomicrobiota bacterium]